MKLTAVLAGALLAGACSGGSGPPPPKKPKADASVARKAVDPATTGTISGVVSFTGTPPENPTFTVPEAACRGGEPQRKDEVLVKDGKLQNAFVWIQGGLDGYTFEPKKDEVVIDQKNCRYTPLVSGVMVGQPLTFVNSDPVLHNVHTMPDENTSSNLGMPQKGMRNTITFDTQEVMVKTKCDVHPWMRAYIGVVGHPFFAVTGADGAFQFQGVPPGDYTVASWHEVYGAQTRKVTLGDQGSVAVPFAYAPK